MAASASPSGYREPERGPPHAGAALQRVGSAAARQRAAVLARHLLLHGSATAERGGAELLKHAPVTAKGRTALDVLPQLSVEEMVGLVSGRDFWRNSGVPRLGIPPLAVTDGPSGVRGPNGNGPASACVPCGIALGASWHPALVSEVGALLGQETRAKGMHILLAPTVNLHRLPITGRHFECFSEDPQLTAQLGVAYIQGVQSVPGVGACVKHFVANDQEHDRMWVSAEVSEQTLRDTYLVPFEAAVREGKALSIMTGYNRVNGRYCSEDPWLLKTVLREEWGFAGLVMSDWFGSHSTLGCVTAGLDLEMPARRGMFYGKNLADAVKAGKVPLELLQQRAGAVLRVMERLGLLDADSAGEEPPRASPNTPQQREVLVRAAAEAAVLLKNEGGVLPLQPEGSVAVIGAHASQLTRQGGGSPQVVINPSGSSVVDALRKRVTGRVTNSLGCDTVAYLPPISRSMCSSPTGSGVMDLSVFAGTGWPTGEPMGTIQVESFDTLALWKGIQIFANPIKPQSREPWTARLRGTFTAPRTGRYEFGLGTTGSARLFIGGDLVLEQTSPPALASDILGVIEEVRAERSFAGNVAVEIQVEWVPDRRRRQLMLGCRERDWSSDLELLDRAVAAAAQADTAVVVIGTDEVSESEGRDQASMALPAKTSELVQRVAEVNPRTVVCLNVGSPKDVTPWVEKIASLMCIWFPGQEGAEALASLLVEDRGGSGWGPGGRLPTTWPRCLADCPAGLPRGAQYPGESGRVFYAEGSHIGYRWHQARGSRPLFPFGHGLSYTSFRHSAVRVVAPSGQAQEAARRLEVQVTVKNVGGRPGKEVVQVYVAKLHGEKGLQEEVPTLRAFAKVALQPQQVEDVALAVSLPPLVAASSTPRDPDVFEVLVGPSSEQILFRQRILMR